MCILIGTKISEALKKKLGDTYKTRQVDPIVLMEMNRFKRNDQYFVFSNILTKPKASKDYSKYILDGREYGKGSLVLEIVKKLATLGKDLNTINQLQAEFPKWNQDRPFLLGSILNKP